MNHFRGGWQWGIGWILALLFLGGGLGAEERLEDPAEAMARQIAKELRCAVCQNQSVYDSNSDLARDMLRIIREKVAVGAKEPEIRDYFFQRYGDYIYLEPTQKGVNLLLWLGPFVGLLVGGVLLWMAVRHWRSDGDASSEIQGDRDLAPPAGEAEAEKMRRIIQEELDRIQV